MSAHARNSSSSSWRRCRTPRPVPMGGTQAGRVTISGAGNPRTGPTLVGRSASSPSREVAVPGRADGGSSRASSSRRNFSASSLGSGTIILNSSDCFPRSLQPSISSAIALLISASDFISVTSSPLIFMMIEPTGTPRTTPWLSGVFSNTFTMARPFSNLQPNFMPSEPGSNLKTLSS